MNFILAQSETKNEKFDWEDKKFYFETLEKEAERVDETVFSFLHLEGAHLPLTLDENLEEYDASAISSEEAYDKKMMATVKLIKKYLQYLKESDAYDNAKIIILADHGFNPYKDGTNGRQNPILFIKGSGETHEKMKVSKKQVSHADLAGAFLGLVQGKKSAELFEDLPEDNRERTYLFYRYTKEDHMEEQVTTGKAWETEKLTPTGREFNR